MKVKKKKIKTKQRLQINNYVFLLSFRCHNLGITVSILNPKFIRTIEKIFKTCTIERIWKFYCINKLLKEFERIENILITSEIIYEMILNNRISNVIINEEKLINDAMHHCTLNEIEISSLKQTNRLCFDRFLHKFFNDGRVSL